MTHSTGPTVITPIDAVEVGMPGPSSERWDEPATVYELAGLTHADIHLRPQYGCPDCPPSVCSWCGEDCADPGHRVLRAGSEAAVWMAA